MGPLHTTSPHPTPLLQNYAEAFYILHYFEKSYPTAVCGENSCLTFCCFIEDGRELLPVSNLYFTLFLVQQYRIHCLDFKRQKLFNEVLR